ncbi:radical SAM protein [bacterium]|nr:radical SAM protein [bacterium]
MMFRNFIKKIIKDKRMYLPVLEMHIVDHCNLKCKGCSHFSNIADEYYVSVEDFRNSLLLASKHFRIHSFALMGGEPFLHPEIKQLIGEARKILPSARIVISSNGMLVDKLGDDVWGELIKNEVFINVSKYPVNSPYFSDILDKIAYSNVLGQVVVKNYFRKYINIKGDSIRYMTYDQCYMKHCVTIKGNNIYKCPFSLYVKYFNKKFNTQIPVSSGLDLTKTNQKEIKKFLTSPVETCQFCTFEEDKLSLYKWGVEEAKKEDWIVY